VTDFSVTIFFNVKYLENGTIESYIYNGGLTGISVYDRLKHHSMDDIQLPFLPLDVYA